MTQETNMAEVTPKVTQAESTIEELKASLAQHEKEKAQYEKDLKSARDEAKAHQKFGQERVTELKNQSDLRAEIVGIRKAVIDQNAIIELQTAAIALGKEGDEEEIAKVNSLLRTKIAEQDANRKADEIKKKQDADALAYQEKASILGGYQKRVEALGLTEEDDDYGDIYRLVRTLDPVDLKTAERRLKKLETAKAVVKDESTQESEDDRIARLVKEKLAKDYPQMYASDAGLPSGGKPTSTTDAIARYGRGEISAEEAKKYGVKFT